jgi:hypothetical protein
VDEKVLHFIRGVGLIKEKNNRSLKVAVQGLVFMAHPLYIHTIHVDEMQMFLLRLRQVVHTVINGL